MFLCFLVGTLITMFNVVADLMASNSGATEEMKPTAAAKEPATVSAAVEDGVVRQDLKLLAFASTIAAVTESFASLLVVHSEPD